MNVAAAALALPLLLIQVWWSDPALATAGATLLALNALPAILAFTLLWVLVRRPVFALAVTAAAMQALYAVHDVKLLHTEQPLVPGDFALATQILRELPFYARYVSISWLWAAVPLGLFAVWSFRPWLPMRSRYRVVATALLLFAGLGLAAGWSPWPSLYAEERLDLKAWSPRDSAGSAGMVAHFLWVGWQTRLSLPAPDRALLEQVRALVAEQPTSGTMRDLDATLPDLLIVQSESLFDPGRVQGLSSHNYLPNLQRLAERGVSGNLRVPTYGGLTTRTEFEVLTGYPMRTFNTLYPYQGLVHRPLHALPRSLKEIGYRTIAIHPYSAHFYRRNLVYPLLGFDAFLSGSDFLREDYYGYYVSDAALTRKLLALLEQGGPPTLLFAVTIENHGPWDAGRPLDASELDAIAVPGALDPEDAQALRMFLHHLARADQALGELAAYIDTRERETWLLFFGDHLPALHGVFDSLGFDDDEPPWAQPVPYLLIGNREIAPARRDLESHELPVLVAEYLGLEHDRYLADRVMLQRLVGNGGEGVPHGERAVDHLALERYLKPVAAHALARSGEEESIAMIDAWAPRGAEQARSPRDAAEGPPAFWVRFAEYPSDRPIALRVGPLVLLGHREDQTLIVPLDAAQRALLMSQPALHAVELVDRETLAWQAIGEFEVRPRGRRARLANGKTARSFCEIEAWGPNESPRDGSANLQPDGSLGLWFRAPCWPGHVSVLFADVALEAVRDDQLVTVAVPRSLLSLGQSVSIRIRDSGTEELLEVGQFALTD